MRPRIKQVIPRDDYTLFVAFEDGKEGALDMKPFLDFGVFQKIKDVDKFDACVLRSMRSNGTAGLISILNMCMKNV
ncbi:MAG: DUF2442 domain-containing protein [Syntrophobacteraceae bacterium]